MSHQTRHPILIIGYGSTLRRDDAIGRYVAERIAVRAFPGLVVVSVTQLVPELAPQVAEASAVIFIDASAEPDTAEVTLQEVTYIADAYTTSHATGPRELLTLAAKCYDRLPPAWLVAVPAASFELSDRLSCDDGENVMAAVHIVEQLLGRLRANEPTHV